MGFVLVYSFSALKYPVCVLPMCYIRPLGVEHSDLRGLGHLQDDSLGLRCKTPSVRSSGICLVSATHPLLVNLHPSPRNRIPQDFVSSQIQKENILVFLPGCRLPSSVFSTLGISPLSSSSLVSCFPQDVSVLQDQIWDFIPSRRYL